jgi:hypothetical protein
MSQPVKAGPRCPEDTPFKQQRLPAWQPILTPNWVIGTFLIVGCIFMPIGGAIFAASSSVQEVRINYGDSDVCKKALPSGTPLNSVPFVVTKDMKNPLVYYELTNFYQNHRRYVTSRSDGQLRASEEATKFSDFKTAAEGKDTLATCTPLVCSGNAGKNGCGTTTADIIRNGRDNLVYYPCGLIARSLFNDTFSKLTAVEGSQVFPLNMQKIAWPSDIEKKFISPNAERLKPSSTDPNGFIGKYCGAFGDTCSQQDAVHPDSLIAQAACEKSGWCSTPIDPSKPDGAKFTVNILKDIAGIPSAGTTCVDGKLSPVPAVLRDEQIYNCWHRCAEPRQHHELSPHLHCI